MLSDDIKVSVYCMTYNHEKYIRDALEGFVHQKTNFKYEVIVHDDASTDNTADIIREYAEKYPDIIKPIYQTENQYSKKIRSISTFVTPRIRGKYVAACEGDDYWTDENKLQLQYDAMEKHPECSMCAHYTRVQRMGKNKVEYSPETPSRTCGLTEGIISPEKLITTAVEDLIHLSSTFFRYEDFYDFRMNMPEYAKIFPVGDTAIFLYMASTGSMYFFDKVMSVYRKGVEGSWTERIQNSSEKHKLHRERYIKALELYKIFLNGRYTKEIDHAILYYRFWDLRAQRRYKDIFTDEYKELIESLPQKTRIKLRLCRVFPWFEGWYQNIKVKIKG